MNRGHHGNNNRQTSVNQCLSLCTIRFFLWFIILDLSTDLFELFSRSSGPLPMQTCVCVWDCVYNWTSVQLCHIKKRKTSKETIADTDAQCEWTFSLRNLHLSVMHYEYIVHNSLAQLFPLVVLLCVRGQMCVRIWCNIYILSCYEQIIQ